MLSETHVRLHLEVCFILNKMKMCRDTLKFAKIKLHENLPVHPHGRGVGQ